MFKQNLVANTGAWQSPKYASANIALVLKIVFVKEKRNGTVRAFFIWIKMKIFQVDDEIKYCLDMSE